MCFRIEIKIDEREFYNMIEIIGNKVVLKESTKEDIDALYFWKYEESEQEAKKWNGPYITQDKISKEEYRKQWEKEIISDIPAC